MNKPMISYILDALPSEVDHDIIAGGYKIDQLRDYFFTTDYPFKITIKEEKEPLGTGGGFKNCQEYIPEGSDFLAFNGDVISSIDLADFVEYFRKSGGLGAIALWPVKDPSRYGLVDLDENNNIVRFTEKGRAGSTAPTETTGRHLINAGTYIFKSEILDEIPQGKNISIEREVFPRVLDRGMAGYLYDGYWIDAGTAQDYINAHKILFDSPASLCKTIDLKYIYPEAVLNLPLLIGDNVMLSKGASIGPYTCIGDNVKVGEGTEIKNSVILEDTIIDKTTKIENTIIGRANKIGSNCYFINFAKTADSQEFADGSVVNGADEED
jgi:mannose-1-phosphate guanylyltransferase